MCVVYYDTRYKTAIKRTYAETDDSIAVLVKCIEYVMGVMSTVGCIDS